MVGLTFSGGGIRSATFSLGVIEALAKSERDALSRIDVLSTVSGGGYIGCFLRSLFMPDCGRGVAPKVAVPPAGKDVPLPLDEVTDQFCFARRVLKSGANVQDLEWEKRRRNPLWWLREHSRYLAPNGPTDYSYAVAYVARNWVAMQYIFLLASLAIFSSIVLAEVLVSTIHSLPAQWTWVTAGSNVLPVSPVLWLIVIPILASMILSVAYWMTESMSGNEPKSSRQWTSLILVAVGTVLGALAIFGISARFEPAFWTSLDEAFRGHLRGSLLVWLLVGGLALMTLSAATALLLSVLISVRQGGASPALTSELRRYLTKALSKAIICFLIIACVGLIDSLGALAATWLRGPHELRSVLGASLLPALAYLIKKLPDWFGAPGKGSLFSLPARFVSTIAFVVGLILYGAVAAAAATIVHLATWTDRAWDSPINLDHFVLALLTVGILTLLSGTSSGFINLSSLHLFYSSRLTRAYLGASNNSRLEDAVDCTSGSSIKENHSGDYIQPEIYSRADLPAPIHIINTTVNETIDPHSELVARDRKGNALSLEPGGVRIGPRLVDWAKLASHSAEHLSLGQWVAISGASASSAMGRLTNLGFALAFTFANVRLGYWWSSGSVDEGRPNRPVARSLSWLFGTFIYLLNEMTARYSLKYIRKYLTDGGHFENSGAYRLIEARIPLIIVCDVGSDPAYRFQDLENLIRTVRLDFGYETEILGDGKLAEFLKSYGGPSAPVFADPDKWPDWRNAFTSPDCREFAVALRVLTPGEHLHIIWMKPRLLADAPADILGYAADNPQFPQQSTGDQFFNEAQWESYRRLGELCMTRLLDDCPTLLAQTS